MTWHFSVAQMKAAVASGTATDPLPKQPPSMDSNPLDERPQGVTKEPCTFCVVMGKLLPKLNLIRL